MTPRLVSITGPLKGQVFPLNEAAISLGRESANRICVSDLSVSRRHCVFDRRRRAIPGHGSQQPKRDLHQRCSGKGAVGWSMGMRSKSAIRVFLFLLQETESVSPHRGVEFRETGPGHAVGGPAPMGRCGLSSSGKSTGGKAPGNGPVGPSFRRAVENQHLDQLHPGPGSSPVEVA